MYFEVIWEITAQNKSAVRSTGRSGLGTFSEWRKLVDIAAKDAESQYGKCLFKAKTDKVKKQTAGRMQFAVYASAEVPVENNS